MMLASDLYSRAIPQQERAITPALPEVLFQVALTSLVVAGLSEMLFLRIASRVGVHIPKDELVLAGYRWLTAYGELAFNVAVLLAVATAALLAYRLTSEARFSTLRGVALPALIGALLVEGALLLVNDAPAELRLTFGLTSSAALLTVLLLAWRTPTVSRAVRLVLTLTVGALLVGQYHVLGHAALEAMGLALALPFSTAALGLAEALVVLAGAAVFWAWFPWRQGMASYRFEAIAASLASLILTGAFVREPSTTSILSLWTSGITLSLPFPLYLASFWLYGATVAYGLRRAHVRPVAFGLVLLFVAGLLLETTYQHLLAIIALTLILEESTGTRNHREGITLSPGPKRARTSAPVHCIAIS